MNKMRDLVVPSWLLLCSLILFSSHSLPAEFEIDTVDEPITGLWWNLGESGWGVTLTQQVDIIFVTLFTYDSNGMAMWYVASNCRVTADGCTGKLFEVMGGSALTDAWNAANKDTVEVGSITFQFTDEHNGMMDLVINGVTGSKEIQRQEFSTLSSDAPMTALWWNSGESGWGATLTQQTDISFVTIFTFDTNGFPIWYVASNCTVTDDSCAGELYEVTGGSAITDTWNGSNKIVSSVGQFTADFSDPDNGTMTFDINGIDGTKTITRQLWAMDTDHDGVSNAMDNCLSAENPSQDDGDGDGIGNACETPLITMIGTGGGTAPSDDGKASLSFPVGALSASTAVSITNSGDNENVRYTMEPDGATFDSPVSFTYTVDVNDIGPLLNSSGDVLDPLASVHIPAVVLRNSDGSRELIPEVSIVNNLGTLTNSFQLNHFSQARLARDGMSLSLSGGGAYILGTEFDSVLSLSWKNFYFSDAGSIEPARPNFLAGTGAIDPVNDPPKEESNIFGVGDHKLYTRRFICARVGTGFLVAEAYMTMEEKGPLFLHDDLFLTSNGNWDVTAEVSSLVQCIGPSNCTGVTHGEGQSELEMCVSYPSLPEGTEVRFTLPDGSAATSNLDADGKACTSFTIMQFDTYTWSAEVTVEGETLTESGEITVGGEEQSCDLE